MMEEEQQDSLQITRLSPDCILGSPYSEFRKTPEVRDTRFFDDLRNDFDKLCKVVPPTSVLDAVIRLPVTSKANSKNTAKFGCVDCILSPLSLNVMSEERDMTGGRQQATALPVFRNPGYATAPIREELHEEYLTSYRDYVSGEVRKCAVTLLSDRSSRPRKRKVRRNRRSGIAEVPVAASIVNTHLPPSSNEIENPAFGIVCVDDNPHTVDTSSEDIQLSSVDPLCVDIKVDIDQLEDTANTGAVSHLRELGRLRSAEKVTQQPCREDTPLAISPNLTLDDTLNQSVSEGDPLQLNDIKVSFETFERDIDDQPSEASHLAEATERSSFSGESMDESTVPSQQIFPILRPVVASENLSDSDSVHNSSFAPPLDGQLEAVSLSHRTNKNKCPICCNLIAAADYLEHVKSHELSTAAQTPEFRRHSTTSGILSTFSCTKCSFKASNVTDLSRHLKQHEIEGTNGNTLQQQSSTISGQRSPVSSPNSSVPYVIARVPGRPAVPLVITLDDDDTEQNSGPPSFLFQNAPSPALQTSVCPTNSTNSGIHLASMQIATNENHTQSTSPQRSHHEHVEEIMILPDYSDQRSIPSLSTTADHSAGKSADATNPSPVSITDRLVNATCTPNPPFNVPSHLPANGEVSSLYLIPQPEETHQYRRDDFSYLTPLTNMCHSLGSEETTNENRLPLQPVTCSVNCSSQSRRRHVDSTGTAILLPDISQPTDNQRSKKTSRSSHRQQRSLKDLCIQTDIIVTPDGTVKQIHTLRRRSLAEVRVGVSSSQLPSRTLSENRLGQFGPSQLVLSNSPQEALRNRCSSPSPPAQPVVTMPREISVIQESPRKSSVICPPIFSTEPPSGHIDTSSHSPHRSGEDSSNQAVDTPAIIPQWHSSTANESAGLSIVQQTASSESVPSADLSCPSAIISPSLPPFERPVSNQSVQATDDLHNQSPQNSRPLESLNLSMNDARCDSNQIPSVSSDQIQSSVLSKASLPTISDSELQFSVLSRIDQLIEINSRVLDSTSTTRKRPFDIPTSIVAKTTSRTYISRNSGSLFKNAKSTKSLSPSEDVNFNPAITIPAEGCTGNDSTASTSCNTISNLPVSSREKVSSGTMPHSDGGPGNPEGNGVLSTTGPDDCIILDGDDTTKSTYDLRRKSLRTRSSSEKPDSSSSESDHSIASDPDYCPSRLLNSDDDSDSPDDPSPVPRAFSKNTNPIPSASLVTNYAATTGIPDFGTSKDVSCVTVACPTSLSGAHTGGGVASALIFSNGNHQHLESVPTSPRSQERDEDSLILTNLLRSSNPAKISSLLNATKPLSSPQSSDSSINQSLQIVSSECSRNATSIPSITVPLPSESISDVTVSAVSAASTFAEAHSSMLAKAAGNTSVIPQISHSANPTASISVETCCESTNAISSSSTGIHSNPSLTETPANNSNSVLSTSQSNSNVEVPLFESNNVDTEISTRTNSAGENPCQTENLIPTTSEVEKLKSNETPSGCKETSQSICQTTNPTTSSHVEARSEISVSVQSHPSISSTDAANEAQLKSTNHIPELVYSVTPPISTSKAAFSGNLPCAEVATNNSPPCGDTASTKGLSERFTQISSEIINLVSDDDSTDVDDPDPKTSLRKRTSSSSSSSGSDDLVMVDPDYVPPSRDKLPLKTPDYVLDAIPSYEHWVRNQFVYEDSDADTPRPENDCRVCFRKFPSHELLKKHREERDTGLKCCKCSFKASSEKTLKSHCNKHTKPKPYKCEECGLSFSKRGAYVKHFLMHKGDFYYKCNICDQGFNEYTPYEGHVNKHLNKTPYKCLKCNLAFVAKAHLSAHKKRKHKRRAFTECTICKKVINKFWLEGHMKRHENRAVRKHLCEHCGRNFLSRLSLTRHMLLHTGERPHMCNYCGATFKVPGALKQHERKHTGERPFKCEVCGKTFAFNTPYTYHLRIHTGERPYKCEYCGMTFAQPSPYAVHKRLHTGERPYKCKICDDAFSSHAAVRNHMKTHANSGNVQKRKKTTQNKSPKPKKTKKRHTAAVVESSSSDSEKESTEVEVPVQSRRRSERQTKFTRSFVEDQEKSDSGEDQK